MFCGRREYAKIICQGEADLATVVKKKYNYILPAHKKREADEWNQNMRFLIKTVVFQHAKTALITRSTCYNLQS